MQSEKQQLAMHTHIWYLGGLVVHSSSHAKGSEEPQPSAQPRQRLVLADVRGEAVDAGFREGRAVIPQQLAVHGKLQPKQNQKKSPDPIDLRRKFTGRG